MAISNFLRKEGFCQFMTRQNHARIPMKEREDMKTPHSDIRFSEFGNNLA